MVYDCVEDLIEQRIADLVILRCLALNACELHYEQPFCVVKYIHRDFELHEIFLDARLIARDLSKSMNGEQAP